MNRLLYLQTIIVLNKLKQYSSNTISNSKSIMRSLMFTDDFKYLQYIIKFDSNGNQLWSIKAITHTSSNKNLEYSYCINSVAQTY